MKSGLKLMLVVLLVLSVNIVVFAQKPKQLTNDDFSAPIKPVNNTSDASEDKLKSVVISLERSGCLGPCPVYKGEKFVKVVGERTVTVDRDKIEKLVKDFEQSGYFNFEDKYEGGPTDATSVVTSLTVTASKKKTISNYHASPNSPALLRDLENKIDAVVNSGQWIQ